LKGDRGFGAKLRRIEACTLQPKSQRHGEASRMRGRDQLFGIGALLVLKTGPERIGGSCENARIGRKISLTVSASAPPDCFRFADHVTLPCYRADVFDRSSFAPPAKTARSCVILV